MGVDLKKGPSRKAVLHCNPTREQPVNMPVSASFVHTRKASVKDIATRFIADHGNKPQGTKMQQISGAAEYALGNYAGAIEPLTTYIHGVNNPQRIAHYQLGLSLFETGSDNARAIEMFNYCSQRENGGNWSDDAITQNSLLHIGIIKLGQDYKFFNLG